MRPWNDKWNKLHNVIYMYKALIGMIVFWVVNEDYCQVWGVHYGYMVESCSPITQESDYTTGLTVCVCVCVWEKERERGRGERELFCTM